MTKKNSVNGKLRVKKKFAEAINHLSKASRKIQRQSVQGASNEFIQDVSNILKRLRNKPQLISPQHVKVFDKHKILLRKLVNDKTSLKSKRQILQSSQTGGILPFLIPIIVASISAAGGIGAAATHAAISKS